MNDKPKMQLSNRESIVLRDICFARMKVLHAGDSQTLEELPHQTELSENTARQSLHAFDFFRCAYFGNEEGVKRQAEKQRNMGSRAGGGYYDGITEDCHRIMAERMEAENGVTLTLLWEEYCVKVRGEGGVPYSYTQYCEKYRRWARVTKATMRITHKPGDAMQVDWAGDPLYITDSVTGEQWPTYIFVGVLPCSWYTYAEACGDMKQENWLLCVNAKMDMSHFG